LIRIILKTKLPAVVLIEMDDVTLELYRRELSKSFEVLSFKQIDGVLDSITHHNVQAVIVEPEISSGRGWELISSINTAFPDHSIPIIVCSTCDMQGERLQGYVTKYLTKPVLPKELKEKTLEVIEKRNEIRKHRG
jgi:response regulator RpfG family c-di-GMP phosphodiesterase